MYTNTQKRTAYLALPENIKSVISSEEVTDKIISIGNKHSLLIDKKGMLSDEIGLVMFGLTHPDKFVDSLKSRLEITREQAETIATDVNNEILLEIREELKKISEKNAELEKTSNLTDDGEHPVESDEHHATLKREDIMRDIEDPAPITLSRTLLAKKPQSSVNKTSPAPSDLPVAHDDNDLPAIIPQMDHSYPTPAKSPSQNSTGIVAAKLGGVVVTATTIIPQRPASTKTPYKTDPYRETF